MGRPLLHDVIISAPLAAVAAGTSDQNGTGIDMQAGEGADGVLFIASIGALTSGQVTSLKAQSSSDDASADAYADIAGSDSGNMADGDSNNLIVLDVFQPPERYIRPVLLRGTQNAVINGIIAIKYKVKSLPTTQGADVFGSESLIQPAEGTA